MIPREVVRVAEDIRKLKIQGATAIAISGLGSLKSSAKKDLAECVSLLSKARPTEPLLRNGLRYVVEKVHRGEEVGNAVDEYTGMCKKAVEKIIEFGSRRIESGSRIMTHCHSSLIVDILKHAARKKHFEVYVCEARPKYQGRITASELSKAGIPVVFVVDSAMRYFINDMDLALVGSDAITADGYFINKIGTSMLALCADEARTEFGVACELLKFDPRTARGFAEPIEERNFHEVWKNPPKHVKIRNPAFDTTPPKCVKFIITEAGIIMPENILSMAHDMYPWLLEW
jgi:ribose 1,5-bisphosphate isomerase